MPSTGVVALPLPEEVTNTASVRLLAEIAKECAVFVLDVQGRIATWSESAQALTGHSADEIVGQHVSALYAQEDRERDAGRDLDAVAVEGRCAREGWRMRKDGSRFWASIVITALRGPGGELLGFSKAIRDVSERRASDVRFRLLECAPEGVLVVNGQGEILYANPRASVLFGYQRGELVGRAHDELVPERARNQHRFHRARFLEAPSARPMGTPPSSVLGLRKDGTEIPVHISLSPMEDGLVVAFVRDTTDERRVAQEQARRAARVAHLNAVASALGEAVALEEVTSVILSTVLTATGSHSALFVRTVEGGRAVEVLGEAGAASSHVEDGAALVRAAGLTAEVVGGRQRCSVDARFPHGTVVRSGSALWLRDPSEIKASYPELAPLFAKSDCHAIACLPLVSRGTITGALRLGFVEEQAFDEEEQEFLTSVARQCALALERAQLFDEALAARDLAERALNLRDEFLSVVAHDLGNPMSVIGLWAKVILDDAPSGPEGEAARTGARSIKEGVEKMGRLLRDLGDVSALDSGHLDIRREPQNLDSIVREAVDSLAPRCEEKKISIRADAPSLRVSCDSSRVRQVLERLISNAIEATPRDGTITVVAGPSDGSVKFCVSDTGPGIDVDLRAHVFERALRGKARDARTRGRGLGLFVSKGIVEAHGGNIWVEGDGGSCKFCFTIPL